jgi:mannosyltransferase OCH1-like enzyme
MKIPKTIHQIWFQGEEQIPPYLLEYHNTWVQLNPDYKVLVWDQKKIENLVNEQEDWIKETYFFYKKMIQKIDFAKYVILYKYGGIYIDMDIKCLQSLNNTPGITDNDLVLSSMTTFFFQKIALNIILRKYIKSDYINNGTIMCVPNTELMLLTMKEARTKKNLPDFFNGFHVFYTTGPLCLTIAYHKMNQSAYKINILDKTYFENCDIFEFKNKTCEIPKHAIGIHYFANTWINSNEKVIIICVDFLMKYWLIMLSCILIIVSLFVKMKYSFKGKNLKNSSKRLKR